MRLVLDEHVAVSVARALQRKGVDVVALSRWMSGARLGMSDEDLLRALADHGSVPVTYDQRAIPPLLKEWAEAGIHHGGVILVNERTLAPSNIGGLVGTILAADASLGNVDWQDRVVYLRRGS